MKLDSIKVKDIFNRLIYFITKDGLDVWGQDPRVVHNLPFGVTVQFYDVWLKSRSLLKL